MMLKTGVVTGFIVALLAGCSVLSAEGDSGGRIFVSGSESFQLHEGDTAILEDLGVSLTFIELVSDSRCPVSTGPEDIQCFWEGQIEADFLLKEHNGPEITFRFTGFIQDGSAPLVREVDVFTVYLERMDPYPTYPDPSDGPVVATLRVERAR